jgi:hypothetical protein
VIELRRQGLSTYEISARLCVEGIPLNRTSVGQILSEGGFGRLLRHPNPAASASPGIAGRDTQLPRAGVLDFTTWPARVDTGMAGLLLTIPDLVALDLPPGSQQRARCPNPITEPRQILHLDAHRQDRLGGTLHKYQHAA